MQRLLVLALPAILLASLSIPACQDGSPLRDDASPPVDAPSAGSIHNEFLELLYAQLDASARAGGVRSRWSAVVSAADAICDKYGVARLNEQQILEAVELGERLARQDPRQIAASLLSGEELEWWDRFAGAARADNARVVFAEHVRRFGAPVPGGDLATFADIDIHSAEFWTARHGEEGLYFFDPETQTAHKGWRKILRFFTAVAVDGLSGAAASSGAGPIGGAVIGGLASVGADCLLYGCG